MDETRCVTFHVPEASTEINSVNSVLYFFNNHNIFFCFALPYCVYAYFQSKRYHMRLKDFHK